MKKLKMILEGWTNYFVDANGVILEEAHKRAALCSTCPSARWGLHSALLPDMQLQEIQGYYCKECGCPLSTAVRSKSYRCPLKKW